MGLVNSQSVPVAKVYGGSTQSVLAVDAYGRLLTGADAVSNAYNITAATVIKASPGFVARISVVVAGSAAGTINDCVTTGAAGVANQIGTIPNTVGFLSAGWPCTTGITVVPGTGQTLAVAFI